MMCMRAGSMETITLPGNFDKMMSSHHFDSLSFFPASVPK